MQNDKMQAALAWAARGFRVFPCFPDEPGKPGNDKRAKEPVWKGWTDWASRDPEQIKAWWTGCDYNVGVLTDGLLVVDIDTKQGRLGMASWMALHGGFDTLTIRTPSGGFHLYYGGANVGLSQNELGEGLDVRSYHGYVLAPGSTVEGRPYTVEIDAPLEHAPPHIVARCKPPGQRAENAGTMLVELDTPAAIRMAVEFVARLEGAIRGEQSEQAYRNACQLRDYGVSEHMAATILDVWAARCTPPIGPEDLRGRVANAYAYAQNAGGSKHPDVMFGKVDRATLTPPPAHEVQAEQAARSGLRLLTVDDCADTAPRGYVIKGMLAPGQVGCIFGQPGAGKSILAPHLAYAVAQGRHTFGQRTKQGTVFYVAAEDEAGMRQRVHALRQRHGAAPGFHLIAGVTGLVDTGDAITPDLAALLLHVEEHRPALIVVDTLAASAAGLDENSSAEMSRIVKAMRSLTRFGAAVILVHHSPKSGDTPRGHGVLNGDLDVSIMVETDASAEGVTRGQLQKNRNGPCNLPIAFRWDTFELGRDEDGDAITAPVCVERTAEEVRADRSAKLTAAEEKAEAILAAMARDRLPPDAPPFSQPPEVPILAWEEQCVALGVLSNARRVPDRRRVFNQARDGLHKKVRIRIEHGCVAYLGREFKPITAPGAQFGAVNLPPHVH